MIFGNLQQWAGIGVMPYYLLIFAALNIFFIEFSYKK